MLAIARDREKLNNFKRLSVDILEHDLIQPFVLREKWSGATLIHLADAAERTTKDNINSSRITQNIIDTMHKANISEIIFSSSIYARREFQHKSINQYGRGKRNSESLLRNCTEVNPVILRLPPIYGPGSRGGIAILAQYIAKGYPMPFGFAKAKRDYLYIGNLVELIHSILIMPSSNRIQIYREPLEPCDGSPTSTKQLIEYMGTILNKKVVIIPAPGIFMKLLGKMVDKQEQIDSAFSVLECRNTKLLAALAAWHPKMTMPQTLSYLRAAYFDQLD